MKSHEWGTPCIDSTLRMGHPSTLCLRLYAVDKTPFSVYDFFAYLASGAMIVTSVDYLFGEQLLLRPTLSPQQYVLLVIASYIVGQVVSHLSAVVLDHWLVKRVLGGSVGVLLASEYSRSPWARLFPQYFHGLKATTSARVIAKAERRGCDLKGDELYDHCYAVGDGGERAGSEPIGLSKEPVRICPEHCVCVLLLGDDDRLRGCGRPSPCKFALGRGGNRGIGVHAVSIPEVLPGVRVRTSQAICGAPGAFARFGLKFRTSGHSHETLSAVRRRRGLRLVESDVGRPYGKATSRRGSTICDEIGNAE
jgi:hypothetical protein